MFCNNVQVFNVVKIKKIPQICLRTKYLYKNVILRTVSVDVKTSSINIIEDMKLKVMIWKPRKYT